MDEPRGPRRAARGRDPRLPDDVPQRLSPQAQLRPHAQGDHREDERAHRGQEQAQDRAAQRARHQRRRLSARLRSGRRGAPARVRRRGDCEKIQKRGRRAIRAVVPSRRSCLQQGGDLQERPVRRDSSEARLRRANKVKNEVNYDGNCQLQEKSRLNLNESEEVGFQREYQIGRVLRERYDAFLSDYHFDDVYGYSTDLRRTKTSLLLVLAGLYPSTAKTAWNDQLNWIPIPISYSKIETNFLSAFQCPDIVDMQKEMIRTPEFLARFDEFKEFNEYLATEIGANIAWKNYLQLLLYNNVRSTVSTITPNNKNNDVSIIIPPSQMSMGLPMPAWCDSTCYENLRKLSRILFDSLVGNSTMARLMVGPTVDRLLDNIHESELEDSAKRKIYLYSAHDFNLVTFEEAHNFTEVPLIPDFGSAIVVEKLKDGRGRIYIRVSPETI
ncbi:unnamed protein product [Trichogramma brassicae]|uniref:acid phosphatase n=1 Tax=Trichogramma brassicae TaxID=86971 RepID=A0A6H5IZJ8_9HYME|nr:unnamed protein product [Trichogramma brassicae]